MNHKMSKGLSKLLISIAIIFHLTVILLYPNTFSHLRRDVLPAIIPYANLTGLASLWQFFAPEPESPRFLEYEIDWREKPAEVDEDQVYRWPPDKDGLVDVFYTRRNSSRAFLSFDQNFVTGILINWICRK